MLLDSTRPIGKTLNTTSGRPKNSSTGVPYSCPNPTLDPDATVWFALRATYSRELKVQALLNEIGLRTFVPMVWRRCPVKPGMTVKPGNPGNPGMTVNSGKPGMTVNPVKPGMTGTPSSPTRSGISRKLVPAVSNLCFVRWTKTALDSFIRSFGDASPVTYYWDRTANRPLTIPDKAMEDFIAVASTMDEDLIYITEISAKLREGQTVKVKEGPFKGVEGKIVRIRKSRRILVELPGMLAVASTYVAPEFLEII